MHLPLWPSPISRLKWQISQPFHILQLVKSPPFHITGLLKKVPLLGRASPLTPLQGIAPRSAGLPSLAQNKIACEEALCLGDIIGTNRGRCQDQMKNGPRSCERNLCNCIRSLKKIQDFNRIWTCDLAIPVRHSNQLGYEATDVGS